MKREPYSIGSGSSKKKKAQKQEKKWAERVGGRAQPASGALWGAKGDVDEHESEFLEGFLWENKYTSFKSYRLSCDTWADIKEDAYSKGRLPGMQIEIRHDSLDKPLSLIVLEETDFLEIRQKVQMLKKQVNELVKEIDNEGSVQGDS